MLRTDLRTNRYNPNKSFISRRDAVDKANAAGYEDLAALFEDRTPNEIQDLCVLIQRDYGDDAKILFNKRAPHTARKAALARIRAGIRELCESNR